MANSRDFTGKNRKFTGTKGITTPKGTTEQRVGSESGELRFNTTTELMEYYDGTQWKPIDAPPTISTVTTSDGTGTNSILNADGSTLYTITINGGNFSLNPTVKFKGSTATEYTATNVTRVSSSQITCKTTNTMGTTDDPYDVIVTNTSGLSATLDDAFSYNAAPVFTRASGTLGTVYNGQVISGTTFNAGATDAEGNSITHTILSGSLPGSGLSIASSTGYITGTLSGSPSLGNYKFVVRASTTEGIVDREFSIDVVANPFISATGGTVTTVGSYKYHTFTSSGSFIVSGAGLAPNSTVDVLLVAGGGGGGAHNSGAGGGAGGAVQETETVTAKTYSIVIGGGGAGNTTYNVGSPSGDNTNGTNSTMTDVTTAVGGGYGGANTHASASAGSGGSGGGGRYSNGPAGTGTSGQGNAGGTSSYADPHYPGGGGGGAGGAGANAPNSTTGGNGGVGINWKSLGTFYAGGGGGSTQQVGGNTSTGGSGGGGNGGGGSSSSAQAGGTNTGGGGGAGGHPNPTSAPGGAGGSGIAIIRYPIS